MKKTVLLLLILGLGFALRCYNLGFPSIGYHNMKENEFLSMAENMEKTNDFLSRKIYFYDAFMEQPVKKLYTQPPLVSYQILMAWRVLGHNLWGPRLFNVLFGLASILVIYSISRLLFQEEHMALFCAFLLAIMPLGVFFSRNLQPESPAFFFMLLGNLYYLKLASSFKRKHFFLGSLFLFICSLYKLSFLIVTLPVIFCLPFKVMRKEKRKFMYYILVFLFFLVIILSIILWFIYIKEWKFDYQGTIDSISLFRLFSSTYWGHFGGIIWYYAQQENFTPAFTFLALFGVIIAFIRRKGTLNRYIIGWVLAAIPYGMIFSDKINQHNYYQMPFLVMVCIASAYAVLFISEALRKFFKKSIFVYLVIFIIGLTLPSIYKAITAMYGVVFLGEDVAGESLMELTSDQERIFLLTHCQGQGIGRYAARYTGWPENLEDFKEKEEKFKIRYICIYPADFLETLKDSPALLSYIQDNYCIKELGLLKQGVATYKIVYFILKRGNGGVDIEKIMNSNLDKIKIRKIYRILGKTVLFFTIRVT